MERRTFITAAACTVLVPCVALANKVPREVRINFTTRAWRGSYLRDFLSCVDPLIKATMGTRDSDFVDTRSAYVEGSYDDLRQLGDTLLEQRGVASIWITLEVDEASLNRLIERGHYFHDINGVCFGSTRAEAKQLRKDFDRFWFEGQCQRTTNL